MKRIIGGALVASPFAAIFTLSTVQGGVLFALSAFAGVALIFGVMYLGIVLLMGEL